MSFMRHLHLYNFVAKISTIMPQTKYNLHLKGYVGGYDFDRDYVDYVLAKNEGKPVHVLIDSLGGSLATALSIASAFKRHGDVTVHFVGMNASAATIASLGARHISIDASAMYLVHKCSAEFFEWGSLNADQLATVRDNCEAAIRDLNKLDNNVAAMYSAKCSKPEADLLDLMRVGGWLTAKEAKAWGFVDEITDLGETKPVLTDAVASAMAAAGMPIPNVPTADKETPFARFLAAIAAFFKPNHTDEQPEIVSSHNNNSNLNPTNPMLQSFSLLGKVLNIEGFAVGEDGVTLTAEQVQAIERAIADRDKRNTELAEQLDAVKKSPADTSTAVINDGKADTHQPLNEVESFASTCNNARELFNQLP